MKRKSPPIAYRDNFTKTDVQIAKQYFTGKLTISQAMELLEISASSTAYAYLARALRFAIHSGETRITK